MLSRSLLSVSLVATATFFFAPVLPAQPKAPKAPAATSGANAAEAEPDGLPALVDRSPFSTVWVKSSTLQGVNTSEIERQATDLMRNGQYEEAIAYLTELAARFRGSKQAQSQSKVAAITLALAESYAANDELQRATQAYEFYLVLDPETRQRTEVTTRIIDLYLLQNLYEEAASAIAVLLSEDRELPATERFRLMQVRSDSLLQAEKWGEALAAIRELLPLLKDPTLQRQYRSLEIVCLVNLDQFDELQEHFVQLAASGTGAITDLDTAVNLTSAGDRLLGKNKTIAALALFQFAATADDLASRLTRRIEDLEAQRQQLVEQRAKIQQILAFQLPLRDLEARLAKVERNPFVTVEIKGRIANTYEKLERPFERLAVLSDIANHHPDSSLAEPSLYTATFLAQNLGLYDEALEFADEYVDRYPESKGVPDMLLSKINLLLNMRKSGLAAIFIEEVLANNRLADQSDRLLLMLGVANFNANQLDAADASFERLISENPESELIPAANYWLAMGRLFRGDYPGAHHAFTEFLAQFPEQSSYRQDAAFRAAVCLYAMERYEESKQAFESWLEEFPTGTKRAEVYSFLGDLAAQEGDGPLAIRYYERATKTPGAEIDSVSYAYQRMAAVYENILQEWAPIERIYQEYLSKYGTTGDYASAIYRIGLAQQQLDREQDMLTTYRNAIAKYGNDVDAIQMDEVVQLFFRTSTRINQGFPWQDWEQLMATAKEDSLRTLELRLLLAASQAGEMRPGSSEVPVLPRLDSEADLDRAPPAVLIASAEQFSELDPAYARELYDRVIDRAKGTTFAADAAYKLGLLEFENKNYDLAIRYLEPFLRDYVDDPKAADAIMMIARSRMEMDDFDGAIANFKQVLENRDWRGEKWAEALYRTGDCHFALGRHAEAHAFYQRVYVLYGGYPDWVARAYVRAAESSEELGLFEQAESTLEEMASVQGLEASPDYARGIELLQKMRR